MLFAAPFAAMLHPRTQTGFTLYVMIAAWLPDLDLYVPGVAHHGVTHTVTFGVVAGLVGGALAAGTVVVLKGPTRGGFFDRFDPVRVFEFVALGLFVGVLSHVVGDFLILLPGTQPVSPFWPISERTYQFGVVRLGAPVQNAILIAAGLALHAVISWRTSFDGGTTLADA